MDSIINHLHLYQTPYAALIASLGGGSVYLTSIESGRQFANDIYDKFASPGPSIGDGTESAAVYQREYAEPVFASVMSRDEYEAQHSYGSPLFAAFDEKNAFWAENCTNVTFIDDNAFMHTSGTDVIVYDHTSSLPGIRLDVNVEQLLPFGGFIAGIMFLVWIVRWLHKIQDEKRRMSADLKQNQDRVVSLIAENKKLKVANTDHQKTKAELDATNTQLQQALYAFSADNDTLRRSIAQHAEANEAALAYKDRAYGELLKDKAEHVTTQLEEKEKSCMKELQAMASRHEEEMQRQIGAYEMTLLLEAGRREKELAEQATAHAIQVAAAEVTNASLRTELASQASQHAEITKSQQERFAITTHLRQVASEKAFERQVWQLNCQVSTLYNQGCVWAHQASVIGAQVKQLEHDKEHLAHDKEDLTATLNQAEGELDEAQELVADLKMQMKLQNDHDAENLMTNQIAFEEKDRAYWAAVRKQKELSKENELCRAKIAALEDSLWTVYDIFADYFMIEPAIRSTMASLLPPKVDKGTASVALLQNPATSAWSVSVNHQASAIPPCVRPSEDAWDRSEYNISGTRICAMLRFGRDDYVSKKSNASCVDDADDDYPDAQPSYDPNVAPVMNPCYTPQPDECEVDPQEEGLPPNPELSPAIRSTINPTAAPFVPGSLSNDTGDDNDTGGQDDDEDDDEDDDDDIEVIGYDPAGPCASPQLGPDADQAPQPKGEDSKEPELDIQASDQQPSGLGASRWAPEHKQAPEQQPSGLSGAAGPPASPKTGPDANQKPRPSSEASEERKPAIQASEPQPSGLGAFKMATEPKQAPEQQPSGLSASRWASEPKQAGKKQPAGLGASRWAHEPAAGPNVGTNGKNPTTEPTVTAASDNAGLPPQTPRGPRAWLQRRGSNGNTQRKAAVDRCDQPITKPPAMPAWNLDSPELPPGLSWEVHRNPLFDDDFRRAALGLETTADIDSAKGRALCLEWARRFPDRAISIANAFNAGHPDFVRILKLQREEAMRVKQGQLGRK